MRTHTPTRMLAILLIMLSASALTHAQTAAPAPAFLGDSLVGKDSFEAYCATCHGADARGSGPVASALKRTPPDLTILASRNRDVFPRDRVSAVLTGAGRTVSAHGTTEMPIWGPLFRAFESDARVRVRIDNLINYLETVQSRPSHSGESGAAVFRTYCASCHGADGRGAGPMTTQLPSSATEPDVVRGSQWWRVSERAGPADHRRPGHRGARQLRNAGLGRCVQAHARGLERGGCRRANRRDCPVSRLHPGAGDVLKRSSMSHPVVCRDNRTSRQGETWRSRLNSGWIHSET